MATIPAASRLCPVAAEATTLETSTIRATTGTGGLPPRVQQAPGPATCSLVTWGAVSAPAHDSAVLSVVSGIDDSLTIRPFDSFSAFPSGEADFFKVEDGSGCAAQVEVEGKNEVDGRQDNYPCAVLTS